MSGTGPVRDAELRALIREVIRDQLGATGTPETVSMATDADLAAFVSRILDMDAAERESVRSGRKRFRLAAPASPAGLAPDQALAPALPPPALSGAPAMPGATGSGTGSGRAARRVERGAVTERIVREAARAGERLILGPAAVLTPLAADRARAEGVPIEKEH